MLAGIEALDSVDLPYAIVGGLAVSAWATPRATQDVDLYAELPDAARPLLERALRERGFDVPAMEAELERFGVFRSRSQDHVFLDIFPAVGPLGEAIVRRRRKATIGGRALWVIAPDDLAVLKAFSDRPRDYEDLVTLVSRAKIKLDLDYVVEWARTLDASIGSDEVSERIHKALASRSED
jgi:predicted nucleotidyltransferase